MPSRTLTIAAFAALLAGSGALVLVQADAMPWVPVDGPHKKKGKGKGRGEGRGEGRGRGHAPGFIRGDAAMTLKGSMMNRTIGPMSANGSFRAIESGKALFARNLTIRQLTATGLQRDGVRLRGDIDGVRMQNFKLEMRPQPQTGPNLPIGIAIASGRNIEISDGVVSGFRMVKVPGEYTNGDGIASERDVSGLTIRRVLSTDNSDAGFDLKSDNTVLDGLRSERNGRNYRFWGSVRAGTLTSINPRGAHIWAGGRANVHIDQLVAVSDSTAPLVNVDKFATVVIERCKLRVPPGTPRISAATNTARVVLGPGCDPKAGRSRGSQ